jgi:predicted ATP-dependent protease
MLKRDLKFVCNLIIGRNHFFDIRATILKRPMPKSSISAIQKSNPLRLSVPQLRWECPVELLEFKTTADVEPAVGIVGQPTANEALKFGIQCLARGQNIYVRGSMGTGRSKMVRDLLRELNPKTETLRDFCYVHNFSRPDHPQLLELPAGQASLFQNEIEKLSEFVQKGLPRSLEAKPYQSQRQDRQQSLQDEIGKLTGDFEQDLEDHQMTLVNVEGSGQAMIFPVVNDEPVQVEQFRHMVKKGMADAAQFEKFEKDYPVFLLRMREISTRVSQLVQEASEQMNAWRSQLIRELCSEVTEGIKQQFSGPKVAEYVDELINYVIKRHLSNHQNGEESGWEIVSSVNVVLSHRDTSRRPIIEESSPTMMNLLGTVEPSWGSGGDASSDHRGIRAGAILNADNGYLILDAKDVLNEPGAWRALMRVLRTERLEIIPPELGVLRQQLIIFPEPIQIKLRVILIGDIYTYYLLDQYDPDFSELFKVLADFDEELPRDDNGIDLYTHVLTSMAQQEGWPPLHRDAVRAIIEHGARIASRANKLTAKFGRIGDVAGEAAFLSNGKMVTAADVQKAIDRTKYRASLPSRKFWEMVENGTILLNTTGDEIGQINGLAVIRSGPLTYGFPARITASIGPGTAGVISIEGSSRMSGAIHTKGFHILSGLLRKLLPTKHPLAFTASIAFEQSYGGIDGDSASAAEMICLLSALTGIPLRQGIAITGAIDQLGHLQAIGGVNEKIEGFFDACNHFELTGEQGVVIPTANANDLMLRRDVVQACSKGKFHIFAVDNIWDALEIFTGMTTGRLNAEGDYPAGSLLAIAQEKAEAYWRLTSASPLGLQPPQ